MAVKPPTMKSCLPSDRKLSVAPAAFMLRTGLRSSLLQVQFNGMNAAAICSGDIFL